MKLRYRAFDRNGRATSGMLEAASAAEATEQLRRDGVFVAEIGPADAGPDAAVGGRGGRVKLKHVVVFMRQLSVLVSTGTPVVEALMAVERQMADERMRAVIEDVRRRVEEGGSLSEAMSAHPGCFDPVCQSLVAAGESGGRLDAMLDKLATLLRQQQHIRSSLIGALIYPCLLVFVSISVLVAMIGFVMPRFAGLFETLDVPLPPTTRMMMALSNILTGYWWAVILGVAAVAAAATLWLRSDRGRRWWHGFLVRVPQFGKVARSFATARMVRLLGVLLQSRVPLLESLELTRLSCTNVHYAELVARTQDMVTRGESISAAFADSPLVHGSVAEAVRNAEKSGRVGEVLLGMADFLDEDNEVIVRSLTSILEPIILIVLGGLVGLVALSMFMPLFDLTAMAGGGQP